MNVGTCPENNKVIFLNKSKAGASLRSLKERFDYKGGVFPCVCCGGYHVGRNKKKAHKNKYK